MTLSAASRCEVTKPLTYSGDTPTLTAGCPRHAGHAGDHEREYALYPVQQGVLPAPQIIEDLAALNPDFDKKIDQFDKASAADGDSGCCACFGACGERHQPSCCMARFDRKKLLPELPPERRVVERMSGPEDWHRYEDAREYPRGIFRSTFPGLHAQDHLHVDESARQWITACDTRMDAQKEEIKRTASFRRKHAAELDDELIMRLH